MYEALRGKFETMVKQAADEAESTRASNTKQVKRVVGELNERSAGAQRKISKLELDAKAKCDVKSQLLALADKL